MNECVCMWCPFIDWHLIQGVISPGVPGKGFGFTEILNRVDLKSLYRWELDDLPQSQFTFTLVCHLTVCLIKLWGLMHACLWYHSGLCNPSSVHTTELLCRFSIYLVLLPCCCINLHFAGTLLYLLLCLVCLSSSSLNP